MADGVDPGLAARFEILRRLGAGGMGVVYAAYDSERRDVVAVKVMRRVDPVALYRFKQEFRVLADIQHPNVLALYELLSFADDWMFTMEMIDGVSFIRHLRPKTEGDRQTPRTPGSSDTPEDPTASTMDIHAARQRRADELGASLRVDEGQLRAAMRQLADGVARLHEANCLHRDLKPSNVLVDRDGRVVVCDFGLVQRLDLEQEGLTVDGQIAGTVAYMSPEQAGSQSLDAASDWYSVGVMLFEALTGRLPYVGEARDVLVVKQTTPALSPSVFAPDAPADLCRLCEDLLRIRPSERPRGSEVLERLGARTAATGTPAAQRVSTRTVPFVGRGKELSVLLDAYRDARREKTVTVFVHGKSGMGKSALLAQFVELLRHDGGAIVLAGRCYERESVPYKAFDSIVDALSTYLMRLPAEEADALMPRDIAEVSRLFPVLRRVRAIDAPAVPSFSSRDPLESRRRAFSALRELLRNVARARPLILAIDDLQWGDLDSGRLLRELLRPPDAPHLLLCAAYRSDDVTTSPLLDYLVGSEAAELGDVRSVSIAALDAGPAHELALSLLGSIAGEQRLAAAITREAAGSPFFIAELARHAQTGAAVDAVALDSVVTSRLAHLPAETRNLLAVIAVAGRPLPRKIAFSAASIADDSRGALATLRVDHLVRSGGTGDLVEPYHDRVREAVVAALEPAALRRWHEALAREFEGAAGIDPELLVEHWQGAGNPHKAAAHAAVAATQAASVLAFDRAARLYQLALDLGQQGDAERRTIYASLGDALAQSGRGAEAAEALRAASVGATAAASLDLRGRAVQALLAAGRFDEGIAALREVLASQGLAYPETPKRALLTVLGQRALLRLRGLGFRERDASQVTPELLARIDLHYYAGTTLSTIDNIRGHSFHVRGVRLALEAGEPYRVSRALAFEAGYRCLAGGPSAARVQALTRVAAELAARVENPHAGTMILSVRATTEVFSGRFATCLDFCQQAVAVYREHGLGQFVDYGLLFVWTARSLNYLGRLSELKAFLARSIPDFEERGNLYVSTTLRAAASPFVRLAADDPAAAHQEVTDALARWSPARFHVQHYYALYSLTSADLYAGDASAARTRLESEWPDLRRSLLMRLQLVRILMWDLRARAALSAASLPGADKRSLLREAERDARRIENESMPFSQPMAVLVRASAAAARGDERAAREQLERAALWFDNANLALHAAAVRRRLGQLVGGDDGRSLIAAADAWMSDQGIRNPERMTALLAPGFTHGQ